MNEFKEIISKAYAILLLERKIVGVKFIKSHEEYIKYDVVDLARPMPYCVAVKSATLGHSIKINRKTSGCAGSTREMMRVIQGYAYHYGVTKNISMSGNQAICAESTVYPYINNTINLSFLCSGTRYLANWSENEVAVGMPYPIFLNVIDGIYNTVNAVEMNERKQKINKALSKEKLSGLDTDNLPYYLRGKEEKRST